MPASTAHSPHTQFAGTGLSDVRWTEGFWAERFEVCRTTMVPNMWRILNDPALSHAYANFLVAAGLMEGEHKGPPFYDGDFYKWLEAAVYVYAITRDAALDRLLDEIIEVIGRAQREDGYIHTPVIIAQRKGGTSDPFPDPDDFVTYNFGHLMTAACAHYHVTGKTNLLDIARKAGDYLCALFQASPATLAGNAICPSHYMGAVDLYRTTGDCKYLDLAKGLIDTRDLVEHGTDQNQDRIPFRQQTRAIGHAVRANYLYAGAADVYAETGDATLLEPLQKIWDDVVLHKMYVTGATGALYDGASPDGSSKHREIQLVHQAYGREYQLPNITAYNESCATIGFGLWAWRMLRITGQARFAEALETVLYNGLLSTISVDGTAFFYRNTLRQVDDLPFHLRWPERRAHYISCFCCPPNIVRTIAQAGNYAYGLADGEVWVHLYGGNELVTHLPDGTPLSLKQESRYPWEGHVRITVREPWQKEFALLLRIPEWARGARAWVNGQEVPEALEPGTYAWLRRLWSAGDVVELELPMTVQLLEAHPLVEEARNQVAIRRGPIVYCLESVDLPAGVRVSEVVIPRDIVLEPRFISGLLGGVVVLEGEAEVFPEGDWSNRLYREMPRQTPRHVPIRLIPHYAWDNRGPSEMSIWLPVDR